MPTVNELSDAYANFMINPLGPEQTGICSTCLTFTSAGYRLCLRCSQDPSYADAVLAVSYSVHLGQLHTALAGYKRAVPAVAARFKLELAAVIWRFLLQHEGCLASRVETTAFDAVTTVPSSSRERDETHPLREIVGSIVAPTAGRYSPTLRRSRVDVPPRIVNPDKYEVTGRIDGDCVLLIDDTWTTGASVQSAAGALKLAGASRVGALVIGQHVHPEFGENEERLRTLPRRFDWTLCAFE